MTCTICVPDCPLHTSRQLSAISERRGIWDGRQMVGFLGRAGFIGVLCRSARLFVPAGVHGISPGLGTEVSTRSGGRATGHDHIMGLSHRDAPRGRTHQSGISVTGGVVRFVPAADAPSPRLRWVCHPPSSWEKMHRPPHEQISEAGAILYAHAIIRTDVYRFSGWCLQPNLSCLCLFS